MLKNAMFAIALTLGSAYASADTTVLTFEDAVPDDIGAIHNYAGYSWYGFYFTGKDVHVGTGFENGRPDYHTGGTVPSLIGSFDNGTPFALKSLYLASADNDNNVVTFEGFRGGSQTPTFTQTLSANTGAEKLVNFNWGEVDTVAIWTNTGHLVIDNVTVSPVPEPSSAAMMLGAAGLVGFLARRKKSAGAKA